MVEALRNGATALFVMTAVFSGLAALIFATASLEEPPVRAKALGRKAIASAAICTVAVAVAITLGYMGGGA